MTESEIGSELLAALMRPSLWSGSKKLEFHIIQNNEMKRRIESNKIYSAQQRYKHVAAMGINGNVKLGFLLIKTTTTKSIYLYFVKRKQLHSRVN